MYRNLLIILALAIGLTVLLIYRPWITEEAPDPRLIDRLPEAEIIGMSNVLELSNSLSSSLYYYKVPFRDLISPNFILSQGKNYGIDVQSSVYVFMNENEGIPVDWGILASVKDSSKVREGIAQIQKFIELETHRANNNKYYTSQAYNMHAIYGTDWLLIYQGNHFSENLATVLSAKHGKINQRWEQFIDQNIEDSKALVTNFKLDWMEEYGLNSADVSMKNDSTNLILETTLNLIDDVGFELKDQGPGFAPQEYTRHMISVHINPDGIRSDPNHILRKILQKHSKKIAFPNEAFWTAWNGDMAFRQGGYEYITEQYVESELDENFDVSEVVKYRKVKVSGFSLYFSMNENIDNFVSAIRKKGILTQFDQKYRLLYSPPLNMFKTDTSLTFYTNRYTPNMYIDTINTINWGFDFSPIGFHLETVKNKNIIGKVIVPLEKISSKIISE